VETKLVREGGGAGAVPAGPTLTALRYPWPLSSRWKP